MQLIIYTSTKWTLIVFTFGFVINWRGIVIECFCYVFIFIIVFDILLHVKDLQALACYRPQLLVWLLVTK
jgi:hypothetical protein